MNNLRGYCLIVIKALADHKNRFMHINMGYQAAKETLLFGQERAFLSPNKMFINGVSIPLLLPKFDVLFQ